MNFLKKLGTPFVALWRWIKETAWVQPLLIVGVIFAIIFSIPYITSGIQNLINSTESDLKYFENHMLSLEGCKNNEGNSQAEKFFDNFEAAQEAWNNEDKETARDLLDQYNSEDRFFLFLVQEECTGCSNVRDGLEYLTDNWDLLVNSGDSSNPTAPSLSWQSINVKETYDSDDYYSDNNTTPIQELTYTGSYYYFYRIAMTVASTTDYYHNITIANEGDVVDTQNAVYTNTEGLINPTSGMQTPTCILIDLTDSNDSPYLITSIFYSLAGSDEYGYADFLKDAWKSEGIFGSDYH